MELNGVLPLVPALTHALVPPSRTCYKNGSTIDEAYTSIYIGTRIQDLLRIRHSSLSQKVNPPLREKRPPPGHHHLHVGVKDSAEGRPAAAKKLLQVHPPEWRCQTPQHNAKSLDKIDAETGTREGHVYVKQRGKLAHVGRLEAEQRE